MGLTESIENKINPLASVKIVNPAGSMRMLPLIIPIIIFVLLEIFFFYAKMIYVILVLADLLIFFTLWQFCRRSQVDKKWWHYLILPVLTLSAALTYTIFLTNKTIIQVLFILTVVLIYFYLRYVFYYLLAPLNYKVFSIANISSFTNFLTFFLLAAIFYGLQSFLNISVWLLEVIMLPIFLLLIYQIVWANKIEIKKALLFILIGGFILFQFSWSISFLPFNYNISGLSLALTYYILAGLIINFLLDKLDKKKIRMYLAVGLVGLFLILITAKWM